MFKFQEAALSWIEKTLQCSSSTKNLRQKEIEIDLSNSVNINNLVKSPTTRLQKNIFTSTKSKKSLKRNITSFNHTESQIQIKCIQPISLPQIFINQSQKQYVEQYCQTANFQTESSFFSNNKPRSGQINNQENITIQSQPKSISGIFKTNNVQFTSLKNHLKKQYPNQPTISRQNFKKSSKPTSGQIIEKKNYFVNQTQPLQNCTNNIKKTNLQTLYSKPQTQSLLMDNQETQNNVSHVVYAIGNSKKNQPYFFSYSNNSKDYSNKFDKAKKQFQRQFYKQIL